MAYHSIPWHIMSYLPWHTIPLHKSSHTVSYHAMLYHDAYYMILCQPWHVSHINVTIHHIKLSHDIICYVLCQDLLCNTLPLHIIRQVMPCRSILWHTKLHHDTPCHAMLYHDHKLLIHISPEGHITKDVTNEMNKMRLTKMASTKTVVCIIWWWIFNISIRYKHEWLENISPSFCLLVPTKTCIFFRNFQVFRIICPYWTT